MSDSYTCALDDLAHIGRLAHRLVAVELGLSAQRLRRVPPALLEAHACVVVALPSHQSARVHAWHAASERAERVGASVVYDQAPTAGAEVVFCGHDSAVAQAAARGLLLRGRPLALVVDQPYVRSRAVRLLLARAAQTLIAPESTLRLVVLGAAHDVEALAQLAPTARVRVPWAPPRTRRSGKPIVDLVEELARTHRRIVVLVTTKHAVDDLVLALRTRGRTRRVLGLHANSRWQTRLAAFSDRGRMVIVATELPSAASAINVVVDTAIARFELTDGGLPHGREEQPFDELVRREHASLATRLYVHSESPLARHAPPPRRVTEGLPGVLLQLLADGARWDAVRLAPRPSAAELEAAAERLRRLGALDGERCLTPLGRRMARLGDLTPELAALVVAGEHRGIGAAMHAIARLLYADDLRLAGDERWRDITSETRRQDPCEALALLELHEAGRATVGDLTRNREEFWTRLRALGIDPHVFARLRAAPELRTPVTLDRGAVLDVLRAGMVDRFTLARIDASGPVYVDSAGEEWPLSPRALLRHAPYPGEIAGFPVASRTLTRSTHHIEFALALVR